MPSTFFEWIPFLWKEYSPLLLKGAWTSLYLAFLGTAIGFLIGAPSLCEFLDSLASYSAAFPVIATIFRWISVILVVVALALTIISLVDYIYKNRNILKNAGE